MTRSDRTTIRKALDASRRAWLERQGGYQTVEREARQIDKAVQETPHGTRLRFKRGCRCWSCREANRHYNRQQKRHSKSRLERNLDAIHTPTIV